VFLVHSEWYWAYSWSLHYQEPTSVVGKFQQVSRQLLRNQCREAENLTDPVTPANLPDVHQFYERSVAKMGWIRHVPKCTPGMRRPCVVCGAFRLFAFALRTVHWCVALFLSFRDIDATRLHSWTFCYVIMASVASILTINSRQNARTCLLYIVTAESSFSLRTHAVLTLTALQYVTLGLIRVAKFCMQVG